MVSVCVRMGIMMMGVGSCVWAVMWSVRNVRGVQRVRRVMRVTICWGVRAMGYVLGHIMGSIGLVRVVGPIVISVPMPLSVRNVLVLIMFKLGFV